MLNGDGCGDDLPSSLALRGAGVGSGVTISSSVASGTIVIPSVSGLSNMPSSYTSPPRAGP